MRTYLCFPLKRWHLGYLSDYTVTSIAVTLYGYYSVTSGLFDVDVFVESEETVTTHPADATWNYCKSFIMSTILFLDTCAGWFTPWPQCRRHVSCS